MLDSLDAAAVRRWCVGGLAALRAHQHEIDELNVYPVPDGDTGTNLVLTLTSAQQALDEPGDPATMTGEVVGGRGATSLGRAMRLMARGALLGARGNSGVIVSQILRGMADTFATAVAVRGGELTRALRMASEAAYAAVAKPVEGTVLSVVAAAAEGARRAASDDLLAVARAAARSAAEALARTPQQLEVLARAGVVDAGGRGLVLLLEALVEALSPSSPGDIPSATGSSGPPGDTRSAAGSSGVPVDTRSAAGSSAAPGDVSFATGSSGSPGDSSGGPTAEIDPCVPPGGISGGNSAATDSSGPPGDNPRTPAVCSPAAVDGWEGFGYEVQYLLDATPEAVDGMREVLGGLGDSLVVVGTGDGDPPTWNVHVHVDDIGAAIEAGIAAGRPHRISVTRLEDTRHPDPPPPATTTPAPAAGTPAAEPTPPDHDARSGSAVRTDRDAGPSSTGRTGRDASPSSTGRIGRDSRSASAVTTDHDSRSAAARTDHDGRVTSAARTDHDGRVPSAARTDHDGRVPSAARTDHDGRVTPDVRTDQDGRVSSAARTDRDGRVPAPGGPPDPELRATVVVAAGDGLTAIFAAEGATVVGRNPSIAEILAAVSATGAGRVVLLPNDANTHAVARSAAQEAAAAGVRVSVVPTRSPVQALAALAVRDTGRSFDDEVIAMAEAAGACRYGEVCTASREALTVAGRCLPGDLLGLVDGEVHVIGSDLEQVCRKLLDRLLGGGGELVTLVLGADAPAELEGRLRGHVTGQWPFVELNSYAGGQPRYHLLVGVE